MSKNSVFQLEQSSWLMTKNPEFIYEVLSFNYNSFLMDQDFIGKMKGVVEPVLKSPIVPHVSLEKQLH
jgi:hypothetical protein